MLLYDIAVQLKILYGEEKALGEFNLVQKITCSTDPDSPFFVDSWLNNWPSRKIVYREV